MTRADEQADELCSGLEAVGAVALRCATIRLLSPTSYEDLDRALSRVDEYGWLLFTSANGARFALDRMRQIGLDPSALETVRVGAGGPRTARALEERGVHPAITSVEGGAVALAKSLEQVGGERVLLVQSDLAGLAAVEVLRRRGVRHIDNVVAYRTAPTAPSAEALQELRRGVDAITFTSPSTVRGLCLAGGEWPTLVEGTVVASIGPVTTAAARKAGLEVHVEALERSVKGLIEALARGLWPSVPGARMEDVR